VVEIEVESKKLRNMLIIKHENMTRSFWNGKRYVWSRKSTSVPWLGAD